MKHISTMTVVLPGACGEAGDEMAQSKTYSILSSNSDPEQKGLLDSMINETTYSLEHSKPDNYNLPTTTSASKSEKDEVPTADEVSPPSCRGDFINKMLCGDHSELNGVTEIGSSSCEFITVPAHDGISPARSIQSQCVSVAEVSHSLYQAQKSTNRTVLMSKCKSPAMQSHVAKMMGCNTTLLSVATRRSLRVQAMPKITDRSTQSKRDTKEERPIQTSPDIKGVDIQTDLAETHDVGVVFPEPATKSPVAEKIPHFHNKTHNNTPLMRRSLYQPPLNVDKKLCWKAKSKIGSLDNIDHKPGGGIKHIPMYKLSFKEHAKAKIHAGSHSYYHPAGGHHTVEAVHLNYREKAKSKVGSLINVHHKPRGGEKKIYQEKLQFRRNASSKVGSLDNVSHKPGGGHNKVFYQVVARRSSKNKESLMKQDTGLQGDNHKAKLQRSPLSCCSEDHTTCSVLMTEPAKRNKSPLTQQPARAHHTTTAMSLCL